MTRVEDDKLLKLKGTSSNVQNYANLAQQSGNLSSTLLWHARFGHINYDSLKLMNQNDIQGLPTIPKQLSQCDACILGKHSKQRFQDSMFQASRKLSVPICVDQGLPTIPKQLSQCDACILGKHSEQRFHDYVSSL
jgi:hypothetical protein